MPAPLSNAAALRIAQCLLRLRKSGEDEETAESKARALERAGRLDDDGQVVTIAVPYADDDEE
jgi:hypothetical protein